MPNRFVFHQIALDAIPTPGLPPAFLWCGVLGTRRSLAGGAALSRVSAEAAMARHGVKGCGSLFRR